MKKKYFTPEMEEMEVEMPCLLDGTTETEIIVPCDGHTPACGELFG